MSRRSVRITIHDGTVVYGAAAVDISKWPNSISDNPLRYDVAVVYEQDVTIGKALPVYGAPADEDVLGPEPTGPQPVIPEPTGTGEVHLNPDA